MIYDLAIIGAGPGGYVAAIRASQLGMKVALIEKDKPGGVCLNVGCIPSKALIKQAQTFHSIADLKSFGVGIDTSKFDYKKVWQKSRDAASQLSKGVSGLVKKNKIDYIEGHAEFIDTTAINVTKDGASQKVEAKKFMIATGSSPRVVPGFEFDEKQVLSSTGILMAETLPKELIILGGGVIGCEFAYVMNSFGVKVTIVEMMDRILSTEDADCAAVVAKSFKDSGIEIITKAKAVSLKKSAAGVELAIEDLATSKPSTIKAERILVSIGRVPNTSSIGLDKIGLKTERGFVLTKDYYQTSIPNIYAIGDITTSPMLAHVASKEGEIAVEHMVGKAHETHLPNDMVPSALYCEPQIGSFGLREHEAKAKGIDFQKFAFPFVGVGKAVATGHSEGFVKLIVDKNTKEILGAHAVGYNATEIIHEILLAKKAELLPEEIATLCHAHPTISEGVMEAARGIEGWAIHI